MTPLRTALAVETRKTAAARVAIATTVFLVLGIQAIAAGVTVGARGGNAQLIAKLGPAAGQGGWDGLVAVVVQITAAATVLGFGVVLSWMVGREFADGTVSALFALPVSRATTAVAKLVVYLLWATAVAAVLVVAVTMVGLLLGLGVPSSDAVVPLLRLTVLTVLSALIAVPAAWAATIGRGILPGIATTVAIIAVAQVMAVIGVGAWFPFTAPALWAIAPDAVTLTQLGLVAVVPLVFAALTIGSWARLQLDR